MVEHQEAWQVFDNKGLAVAGSQIAPRAARADSSAIVGAVHVWVWKKTPSGIEVLLQHRAKDKPTWPDYLDISVAGHVDFAETLPETICREANEEIGASVSVDQLEYIFSYRNFDNGIKWVYLLEQIKDETYTFNDGEVQALKWVKLPEFEAMIKSPDENDLVPHPPEYFSLLLKAIQHFA